MNGISWKFKKTIKIYRKLMPEVLQGKIYWYASTVTGAIYPVPFDISALASINLETAWVVYAITLDGEVIYRLRNATIFDTLKELIPW